MTERTPQSRKPNHRRLPRLLLLGLVTAMTLPVVGLLLVLDDTPLVLHAKLPSPTEAREARQLVRRAIRQVLTTSAPGDLVVSERELNALASLAGRAFPGFRGHATITRFGLEGFATLPVSKGPLEHFINVRAGLAPSSHGINVTHLLVGDLRIPGPLAISAMRVLGDLVLGDRQGSLLIDTVRGLHLEEGLASVRVNPSADLRLALQDARARTRFVRDELGLFGNAESIGFYYDQIESVAAHSDVAPASVSLAAYLGPLFALAYERSTERDPVTENESLIYAVATYFGNSRFAGLTGMSSTSDTPEIRRLRRETTLAGRRDLRLHFIISAGLELLSTTDASIAVGEFKELLDAGEGGSGYSFTDLAADRAGVRFASRATESPDVAREVQAVMAEDQAESTFFPALTGLKDGLSEDQFVRLYGGVEGRGYREVVAEIDARIAALPLHRP